MTIKQQGGIFGRNPTFNDVNIEGDLSLGSGAANTGLDAKTSAIALNSGLTNASSIPALGSTPRSGEIRGYSNAAFGSSNGFLRMSAGGSTSEQAYIDLTAYFANAADRSTVRIGTAGTERFAIDYNGNAHMRTGNLSFISGKGIDFSATSGTGTSELFDDYEEGNYTGTLTPSTSGSITVNSLANYMSYTKIGRVVNIHGFLEVGSVSSPVGTYVSLNLPFTIISLPDDGGRFGSACRVGSNLQAVYALNGASTARISVDASTIGAATQFYFSFSYMAA